VVAQVVQYIELFTQLLPLPKLQCLLFSWPSDNALDGRISLCLFETLRLFDD